MGKSKSQLQEDIAKFDALINKSTTSEEQKKVFRTIKAKAEAKLETIDKEAPKKAEPKPKETTPKGAKTTIDGDEYIIDKFRDGSSAEYNNYKIYENKSGFWDEIKKPETKKDLINSTKRKVATPPVKKPAAKKKTTKKKPAAKKKTVAKKSTTTKGGNTGSFAKLRASIAKRDGLTYKQALPIAKKEYAAQKESLMSSKKAKSETRLSAYKRKYKGRGTEDVKESGSMRALDVEKDAKIPALKRGKRTSKGTGANQYGKAKKGGIYYENRSNRSDVRQPSKTVAPPKLAKGGTTKGQTLAENFNLKDEVKSVEFWNNDVIVKDKLGKIKRIDLDKGERISLKAEGGRINIVNEGEKFDKKKYKGALGDFDKDGVANIDDSRPLVNTGKKETVEQVELAKTFDKLLKLKAQLDSTMNVTVDELDKVAPKGAQIYARTKTPYSILNKLVEKRLLDKNKGLNDLVGTTIAVDNYKDLRAVDSKIRSGTIGKVIEVEDMYDAPKGGYRAVHYLVESDGYIIEVQLKTKRQKDVNVLSHDAYKKGTLNKQFLLDLTDLANKADKGEGDAEKEFSKLMKDKKALEKRLDSSFGFGGEIARSYDVNINSGVGTYAKGGDVKYEDPRAVRLWNERGYDGNYLGKLSEKELQRLFDTEFYFELNETEYAKGGFIQKAVENMKEKGTVGAFTKQANRREMTPVDFAKMVLKTPDAYSETTRKRAQFVKNANPELFSFGGEIARSYDVNINSGVGTYAKGGITEAGDTDFPSELLNYAKGGRTQETLEPNELQDLGYRHGEDAVNKIPKSIFHQPQFMEYVSAYVKQFYDYAEVSKDFDVNNYAKGGSLKRSNNSPMLRYVNFEDGWHINLKKLKSSMNQNGKPYKGNNKYGISRQGRGQEQEIWEFETLNEATTKYNELVKLGKTYSKIDKQGEVKSNYEKGGKTEAKFYNVEIILQSDEDSWATDILPFAVTESQAKRIADKINRMKPKSAKAEIPLPFAKGGKTQGYNSRLDESLGNRTGAEVDFEQKNKDRRDESKAMEKSMGKRAYSSVRTMDRNNDPNDLYGAFAKGGEVKFKEVSAKRLKFLLKLKRSENLDTLTDYKVDGQVYFIAYGSGKDLNSNNLYLFKKTNSGNKPLRVVTTSYQQGGELMDADTQVDYAKGGKMYYQDDLPPLIIFSFDDKYDADSFFNDAKYSMPDNDIVRLSDNSIQFIGSRQDADFLSQRAESYNSYDKFAKGGKTEAKVYNVEIILQSDEDSWATDILPFAVTKSQAKRIADKINRMKPKSAKAEIPLPFAKGGKTQGYNSRLDESLGNRTGAEVDFEQKNKDRRDESKAMEKSMGKRAYSSVRTMDKMAKGGDVGQNGYIAMYKGKKIEVYADSSYAAQKKAAEMFNAKKSYDVNVYLAEKDGKTVMQSTMFGEGGRSKSRDDMFLSQEKHEQEYAKKRKKKVSYKKRK